MVVTCWSCTKSVAVNENRSIPVNRVYRRRCSNRPLVSCDTSNAFIFLASMFVHCTWCRSRTTIAHDVSPDAKRLQHSCLFSVSRGCVTSIWSQLGTTAGSIELSAWYRWNRRLLCRIAYRSQASLVVLLSLLVSFAVFECCTDADAQPRSRLHSASIKLVGVHHVNTIAQCLDEASAGVGALIYFGCLGFDHHGWAGRDMEAAVMFDRAKRTNGTWNNVRVC